MKEQHNFQADITKLLNIVTHSLYSQKEIFLRELLANAADACDRLKYAAFNDHTLSDYTQNFRVLLFIDKSKKTLTIADNGIGMSKKELIENLGTIAKSGAEEFLSHFSNSDEPKLIGRFGIGFYSSFIVADKVRVVSRLAGEEEAWVWESDGISSFEINTAIRNMHGTSVILYLKSDAEEFLEDARLKYIVKKYSNYLPIPVCLVKTNNFEKDFLNEPFEQLNDFAAIWLLNKNDVKQDEYNAFYQSIAHIKENPLKVWHFHTEGMLNYYGLIFLPRIKPFDLSHPTKINHLKLYHHRVFITDSCEELLPRFLRFLRGVIDCEDIDLNASREVLQNSPIIGKLRQDLTKRICKELKSLKDNEPEIYDQFFSVFGIVLKEGLCDPLQDHESLLNLIFFHTTKGDKRTLDQYLYDKLEQQKNVYFAIGDSIDSLKKIPQLEVFLHNDIEVLLLTDPVDAFWAGSIVNYKNLIWQSVNDAKISLKDHDSLSDLQDEEKLLLKRAESILHDYIGSAHYSKRLVDSPVCLVNPEGGIDSSFEKILKENNKLDHISKKNLEFNKNHPVIKKLIKNGTSDHDLWLLFDQARILSGELPIDPHRFVSQVQSLMQEKI